MESYIENKKNTFKHMIGALYYNGCLGYTDIYVIALLFFKNNIDANEITHEEVRTLVYNRINCLIDLD